MRGVSYHRAWGALHAQRNHISGLPDAVAAEAAARFQRIWLRHLAVHADLSHAARVLGLLDVPWAVVKGPVLGDLYYPSPGLRPYHDLDVLVAPEDLTAALASLESNGWRLLDRNWTLNERRMVGQIHLLGSQGTEMDLHWSLHNRAAQRQRNMVLTRDLLATAVPVVLDGVRAFTLDWVDTVIHLAVHAAGSGADRLIWLSDVHLVADHSSARWRDLPARAAAWGASASTALVLSRAGRTFGPTAPQDVLRELDPRRWVAVVHHVVDRGFPASRQAQPFGLAHRWARLQSMGETPRPTRRARHPAAPTTFTESPDNPWSMLFDSGGEAGKRRYLEAVADQARR